MCLPDAFSANLMLLTRFHLMNSTLRGLSEKELSWKNNCVVNDLCCKLEN